MPNLKQPFSVFGVYSIIARGRGRKQAGSLKRPEVCLLSATGYMHIAFHPIAQSSGHTPSRTCVPDTRHLPPPSTCSSASSIIHGQRQNGDRRKPARRTGREPSFFLADPVTAI